MAEETPIARPGGALAPALRAFFGMRVPGAPAGEAGRVLAMAERGGFRLLLLIRSAVLLLLFAWQFYGFTVHGSPRGMLLVAASLLLGLAVLAALKTPHERRWHRYALFALDIAGLTLAASLLPLMSYEEVPRILLFRAYGTHFLWTLLVATSLSLMPGLVLFAGAALTAGYWCVIAVIAAESGRLLSWSDLAGDPGAADFLQLMTDVNFINWALRYEETGVLLASTLLLALAVGRARRAVLAFAEAERRRRRAEDLFGHFVPADVANRILDDPEALRPQVKTATVLFLDIEGFTGFAEGRAAATVMTALDSFFSDAARTVADEGGTAIGFAGDAMLATFGMPRRLEGSAASAIAAALVLLARAETARYDGARFRLRIGVASGPLAAGAIGRSQRSYTVYGDTVNVAQRLEAANKRYGSRLLVCQDTWRAALEPKGFTGVGAIALEGRQQPIEVYRLD